MSVEEKLARQFKFLKYLKKLSETKLRRLHDKKFVGSTYGVKIPKWMHRSIVERRLFYYFCLKNYHYPKNHEVTKQFRKAAKKYLSKDYVQAKTPEEVTKERIQDRDYFTGTNIRAMPIAEVDRCLARLGLFVEADERSRRKVLYEWFNEPANKLIRHLNDQGTSVAPRRKGKINNQYKLRDLILEHPTLGYDAFMEAFGNEMPTVTRASFNNTRSLLKKAGYEIPPLKKGSPNPAVVTGPGGIQRRARMLADIPPQE